MDAAGLSIEGLALRTGYSEKHVRNVLGGHVVLTPRFCVWLEVLGLGPAWQWSQRQAAYSLTEARKEITLL